MTEQWRKLDRRLEWDASALSTNDICYYYYDHTEGGYSQSRANQLVFNLKKPLTRRGKSDWHYKIEAIEAFAENLASLMVRVQKSPLSISLIAMPTSKNRQSDDYDDRIVQVVKQASDQTGIPWLDCFETLADTQPVHLGGTRSATAIRNNLALNDSDERLANYDACVLVDDVLTSGSHFIACKELLKSTYPHLQVVGAFWTKHRTSQWAYGTTDEF